MSERIKFTVYRATWLRGEGSIESRLIRASDCKKCCVGFLALSLGIPREDLLDVGPAHHVETDRWPERLVLQKKDHPFFLGDTPLHPIYETNDIHGLPDAEREAKLTEQFAELGIDVTFEDGPEP